MHKIKKKEVINQENIEEYDVSDFINRTYNANLLNEENIIHKNKYLGIVKKGKKRSNTTSS